MDYIFILSFVFVAAVFIQSLYFLFIYRKLAFHKESHGDFINPVSLVICGYNESENLKRLLPLIV